jgi:hypothetical protein
MTTYNMNFISDKKEYWVSESKDSKFAVVFKDKSKAHQYKLSLTLGSATGPWESVEGHELIKSLDGIMLYQIKDHEQKSDWKDESCCQSGCPGCPWTLAQE